MCSVQRRSAATNLRFLPDATGGIATEGMQKIAREFNFPESTFVLPKEQDSRRTPIECVSSRLGAELNFAGTSHDRDPALCALVMKQHAQSVDPIPISFWREYRSRDGRCRARNGGYHGTLTLSGEEIDAPAGAPAPADLASVLSIEPGEVSQCFFAGVGLPFCFAQLKSNEAVDRAAVNRAGLDGNAPRERGRPTSFSCAGDLRDFGGNLYAAHVRHQRLGGSKRILWRRAAPVPPSSAPAWHRSMILRGTGRLSPFDPARCLYGAPKRNRSGGA